MEKEGNRFFALRMEEGTGLLCILVFLAGFFGGTSFFHDWRSYGSTWELWEYPYRSFAVIIEAIRQSAVGALFIPAYIAIVCGCFHRQWNRLAGFLLLWLATSFILALSFRRVHGGWSTYAVVHAALFVLLVWVAVIARRRTLEEIRHGRMPKHRARMHIGG